LHRRWGHWLSTRLGLGSFFAGLGYHAEFGDQIEGSLDVQVKRFETGVDADVILVEALAFRDPFEGFDRTANELGDIVDPRQDLGVRILFDELEQLVVDNLDAGDLVSVLVKNLIFAEHFVLFLDVLLCEALLQLVSTLLQLLDELVEALVNVAGLLLVESLDLLLDMLDELAVVVVDPLGVQHQLV